MPRPPHTKHAFPLSSVRKIVLKLGPSLTPENGFSLFCCFLLQERWACFFSPPSPLISEHHLLTPGIAQALGSARAERLA